jgi:hypothetical protein
MSKILCKSIAYDQTNDYDYVMQQEISTVAQLTNGGY